MAFPTDDISPEDAGRFTGALLTPVLFAVVARWIVVRLRRRGDVLSPWVPVLATFLLLITLYRAPAAQPDAPSTAAATAGPTAASSSQPIAAYLAVDAPYRMEGATTEEATQFKQSFGRPGTDMEIRRLTRSGTVEGFLVVIDAGSRNTTGGRRAFETGIRSQPGVSTERSTIAGREVILANVSREQISFVAWLEGSIVLVVYGQDIDAAKNMAEAVIAAYQ